MENQRIWGVALAVMAVVACAPSLQVRTDFDRTVSFANYRTYRLEEGKFVSQTGTPNTLVKDRIDGALRTQLAAEGLTPAGQNADLVVRYVSGARTVQEIDSIGYPSTVGLTTGMVTDVWVSEVPQGMLVIDLVDAYTKKLVWRAYCRAEGEGLDKADFIRKAVSEAFKKYPPVAGS